MLNKLLFKNIFIPNIIASKLGNNEIKEEIKQVDNLIFDIINEYPTLIRPSYGTVNKKIKSIIDRPIITWNVDTLDWKYHNSKMIANKVYANRLGNGATCTNDGYIYRGRGIIQITGKENYRKLNYETGINCVENPDLLLDMHFAVISAFWFWDYRKLQGKTNIEVVTKLINGGLNGIEDRKNLYLKVKKIVDTF